LQEVFTTHYKDGLTREKISESRKKYGNDELSYKQDDRFGTALKPVIKEHMVLLLLIAASIYFVNGNAECSFFF